MPSITTIVCGLPSCRNRQTVSISICSIGFSPMNLTSYVAIAIGKSYHIYGGIFLSHVGSNKGENMLSMSYDYAREVPPPFAAARPRLLLIDGQHVPSASGRTFKTLNPATEQVIATVAEGNEADVDRAVAAARRAFEGPWRTMRASERGQILLKWAQLLRDHTDEIVEIESLDAGKPISATLRQDFPAALDTLT